MSYLQKTLLPREKIIYAIYPHWVVFTPALWALAFALFLLLFGQYFLPNLFPLFGITIHQFAAVIAFIFAGYQAFAAWISYTQSEYAITNERILAKTGWIQRYTIELLLEKVESIRVNQTITGRIFGYGTIIVTGTGGTQDIFYNVPDPLKFREKAQEQMEIALRNPNAS